MRRVLRRLVLLLGAAAAWPACATTLVIATVDNAHMLQLQSLAAEFTRVRPDVRLRWITLPEGQLRKSVSTDIMTRSRQYDVVTVGMYEVPIWARQGWLTPIRTPPGYRPEDLMRHVRAGLSYQGQLYGAPLYGESSMLYYRKDLLAKAGMTMPDQPTWAEIARYAAAMNDPKNQVHGICLRAKPGWGENISLLTTMANAQGGQWFDMQWQPQLQSEAWQRAVGLYVDLLRRYGPPDAVDRGYNENLSLFLTGRCAIWVDATVAAGFLADPAQNPLAHTVGFAQAPVAVTSKGARWLWAWALAIPADIQPAQMEAAQAFVTWATSRAYIQLVAERRGWGLAPPGTRYSTYADPRFQRAAPWARHELEAIRNANPRDATLRPSPYLGVQFVTIPEFAEIGDAFGLHIADAVAGRLSVKEALARGQEVTRRRMLTATPP